MPNLTYTFADALSEILPRLMPEVFSRRDANGELVLRRAGLRRDVLRLPAEAQHARKAPLTDKPSNITNFANFAAVPCHNALCADVEFDIDRYLAERGDARIKTWSDWVANAKFRQDESRAGAENWVAWDDHQIVGKADRLARSYVARMALLRVMYENGIDAFVHPEITVPTPKIQGPNVGARQPRRHHAVLPDPAHRRAGRRQRRDLRARVRAERRQDRLRLRACRRARQQTRLPHPMPISITFFAGQGDEPTLIKIGTAYESATHHRFAPPAFGPVRSGATTSTYR